MSKVYFWNSGTFFFKEIRQWVCFWLLHDRIDPVLDQKMVAFDFANCVCFRFVNVLVYYGLSLNISDFGMNIYLTQMIFGLVEMPARTVTLFTLNRSRRISQLAFLATGGLACLLTIFIPNGKLKIQILLDNHKNPWIHWKQS